MNVKNRLLSEIILLTVTQLLLSGRSTFPLQFNVQSTIVISTSLISNNHLCRSENLILVLTWKSRNMHQNIVEIAHYFSSFPQYVHILLTLGVKLHIHLINVVVRVIFFSSSLQILYVEVRISRNISGSPLDFEIKWVDCTLHCLVLLDHLNLF